MKLPFRSLLLKIFFWFWATVIATGICLILTFILQPHGVPSQWHSILTETARYSGTIAVQTFERDGGPAASAYLERLNHENYLKACLFDASGKSIAGINCETFQDLTSKVRASNPSEFSMRFGIARVALLLKGERGHQYIFASELPAGPRAAVGFNRTAFLLQWGVAFLVSGFICYLLTRYLTTPILSLRAASRQLASGDLSTRASATIASRQDELGDLVRDFDAMAARIEALVSGQRQLISDVSHELRSPLARLNVALDLGRQRKGNDAAFDQMEQDLALLNEMIGRLLTIAKLDTSAREAPMMQVNLTELVAEIVRDASFESRASEGDVQLTAEGEYFVRGNAAFLHSAIENVVRNAIRYTPPGTSIEIQLELVRPKKSFVRIAIRDHGPGVPESELVNIFRPFYRVADARDRQSGGAGLGLAIADRVIQTHGGTIQARNAPTTGLIVEIVLPRCEVDTL